MLKEIYRTFKESGLEWKFNMTVLGIFIFFMSLFLFITYQEANQATNPQLLVLVVITVTIFLTVLVIAFVEELVGKVREN